MQIACVYFGIHRRGCWKRLAIFINGLAADGHAITLITSHAAQEYQADDRINKVVIRTVGTGIFGLVLFLLQVIPYLAAISLAKSFDRFIAFDCHNALAFSLAKFIGNTPVILFIRGFYKYQDTFASENAVVKKLVYALNYLGYKTATRVRFNSDANKRDTIKEFGSPIRKISVIRNNIAKTDRIATLSGRGENSVLTVGYLGQLVDRKNVRFLIDAVAQCDARVSLIIQGEGANKDSLQAHAKAIGAADRIHFWDWSADTSGFFKAIDVFVLPSFYDDASNALIEAVAAEKIVLASDRGGSGEILHYRDDLLFCPVNGQSKLTATLTKLASDAGYRADVSRHIKLCKASLIFDWYPQMKKAAMIYDARLPSSRALKAYASHKKF